MLDANARPKADRARGGNWPPVRAGAEPAGTPPNGDLSDSGEIDLEALAREIYQLLLREAYVERERLGRTGPVP
jgi:hypothetical protein